MRVLVALLLASLLLVPYAHAAPVTKTYVGWGELGVPCAGVGGACFTGASGATVASVEVHDASGLPVFIGVYFVGPGGAALGSAFSCGEAAMPLPVGTRSIEVLVGGPRAAAECPVGSVGVATSGTITVTFG